MEKRTLILTHDTKSLLIKFGLPSLLATVINALYSIVDRIFVGKVVGENGLAAITICFPVLMIMMALGMLFAMGGSALISLYMGENKRDLAEKVVGNGLTIIIAVMAIFMIGSLLFINPLLQFFGASAETLAPAKTYLLIILLGSIPHEIGFGINSYIRGEGNINFSVFVTIVGAISNIILDAFFVFVIPLGIKGVAIGTLIAWNIRSLLVLFYFLTGRGLLKFKFGNMKPDFKLLKRLLSIGIAPCMMMLLGSVTVGFLNRRLLTFGGDVAIAAYGIQNSINQILRMPVQGLTGGAQPIIGYNYGAGLYSRVRRTEKQMLIFGIAVSLVGMGLVIAFPRILIGLFASADSDLMGTPIVNGIRLSFSLFVFSIISNIFTNYFQAVGKARSAFILSISRMGIFLPLMLLLIPGYLVPSLTGVWLTLPATDILAGILATGFMVYEWRHSLNRADKPLDIALNQ